MDNTGYFDVSEYQARGTAITKFYVSLFFRRISFDGFEAACSSLNKAARTYIFNHHSDSLSEEERIYISLLDLK